MNLFEKYKEMVRAQKEPPPPLVVDNTTFAERVTPTPIIVQAVNSIEKGLKKSKVPAEGIEISPVEIVEPEKKVKAAWPPEVQILIDSFLVMDTQMEPFYLEPHRKIVDPAKFYSALRMDIKGGPDGPRGKHDVLIHDLIRLKKILH